MERRITPVKDLITLYQLTRLMCKIRPSIVHSHTPKAGLLGTLAARAAGVPIRIYHLRGLPCLTTTGWKRQLLETSEKIAGHLAHRVIAVSHSVRHIAIEKAFAAPHKITVLANGSGNGVDLQKTYNLDRYPNARQDIRARYRIPSNAVVIGFVGRLTKDKGLAELTGAWRDLSRVHSHIHLLVVGPSELANRTDQICHQELQRDPRVHLAGACWETAPFYAAMDVLVLPTYREGFPNVLLEGAAMKLPVVATNVPGCVDAVIPDQTGQLVSAGKTRELTNAIQRYVKSKSLRMQHARQARRHVETHYRQELIWQGIHDEYQKLVDDAAQQGTTLNTHQHKAA